MDDSRYARTPKSRPVRGAVVCVAWLYGGCAAPAGPPSDAGTSGGPRAVPDVPHAVLSCDSLVRGRWESIVPPETHLEPEFDTPAGRNFGMHSIVLDPQNAGTVYLGTSAQGIYRSTDCGANWIHVNTGTNGAVLDRGRQWTFVIDPVDPQVLYANAGYGTNDAWKSTNGGVDWQPLIRTGESRALQFGGFVAQIVMDPTDRRHLLVTPHFECEVGAVAGRPTRRGCVLETTDAGETWRILDSEGTPTGGEGGGLWMEDSRTWYWATYFGGLHRTTDGGQTWQHLFAQRYAQAGHYRAPSGTRYIAGVWHVLESADGVTWSDLDRTPGADTLISDGRIMFVSRGGSYSFASTSDLNTWTELPRPAFPRPDDVPTWAIAYDSDHRVLYSINSTNGAWRYAMP
jgi:hypothetical protein